MAVRLLTQESSISSWAISVSSLLGLSSVLSNTDSLRIKTIPHLTILSNETMVRQFVKSMHFQSTWRKSYPWSRTTKREDAPKVEFFESVAESKDAVEMKAVSSTLNYVAVGRNKLFAILREQKVLQSNNIPYQKYIDAGYFRTIETKKNCGTEVRIFIKTLVYQKGLDYIRKLLNKLGYKPKESKEQTLLEFKD